MLGQNDPQVLQILPPQQEQQPTYDFNQCKRIKKLTTHDIYRLTHQGSPLVVKLFASSARLNFQQQLRCLRRATHPAILRILYHRESLNPNSLEPLISSHMIVIPQATRGDLNDYLPKYGHMNQKMSRTYFKFLVEALLQLSLLKPALIHPNLMASSLLLTTNGELRICGWSQIINSSQDIRLGESVFSCGEILICLLTSFMPFYKKNSPTDTFYKFCTPEHIHKFWQELQKRMCRIDKKFIFSSELRDLINNIFLKKYTTFQQLLGHPWTKLECLTLQQLKTTLSENQKYKEEKFNQSRKQLQARQQKKKRALHDYQLNVALHRSGQSDEHLDFIKDCQQNVMKEEDIPAVEGFGTLKIQASPNFVIASIKDYLREESGKNSLMLFEQFVLRNHKVVKISNYAIIQLQFSLSLLEQQEQQLLQPQEQEKISLKLKLSFSRQQKDIFVDVTVVQSNFNTYYTNLALKFIEERIQRRKEVIKSQEQ